MKDTLLRHPWRVLALWCFVGLLLTSGMAWLKAEFSATAYFSAEDPARERLDAHQQRWGVDVANFAVIVQGEDWTTGPSLRRLEALAVAIDGVDGVQEGIALPRVPRLRSVAGRPMLMPTIAGIRPDAGHQPQLLDDPQLVPAVLSSDGRTTAVAARLTVDADKAAKVAPVLREVRERADAWALPTERVWLAGMAAVRAELLSMIVANQSVLVPASLALVTLGLWIAFRRASAVAIPLVGAGLPVLLLIGIMGWTGEPLGILNQVYFTLIPVIAVADAIHLVHRFDEERAASPDAPSIDALSTAVRQVGPAVVLTTATTVAGFASMGISPMPALRSFGAYAGLGLLLALAGALTLLPALLVLAPGPMARPSVGRLDGLLHRIAQTAVHQRQAVLALAVCSLAVLGFAASRVAVEHAFTADIPPDSSSAMGAKLADEELGGVLTLALDIEGDDVGAAVADGTLGRLGRDLALLPQVRWVEPVVDARIVLHTVDPGARAFLALSDRVERQSDAALAPRALSAHATGTALVAYRGITTIAASLRTSLLTAFVVISAMILLLFRDVRLAAASFLPNALPLAAGGAVMWLLGWALNPVSAVVFAIALGVVVDDTVHVLARYREERMNGLAPEPAVVMAVRTTGRAVLLTTALLIVGFGVNALSTFPTNQTFGVLGTVVLSAALVGDLVVLPALVVSLDR